MKYFLDTEFYENGETILPISLAILCEDLRYFYVEFPFDPTQIPSDHFVSKHVLPLLQRKPEKRNVENNDMYVKEGVPPPAHLTDAGFVESVTGHNHPDDFPHLLERWIGKDEEPEFWAYYADYDWVLLCQRFGTMVQLPKKFPKFCMDLQQWWVQLGKPENVKPPKPEGAHDALVDAQWNRLFYAALTMYEIGLKIPSTGRTSTLRVLTGDVFSVTGRGDVILIHDEKPPQVGDVVLVGGQRRTVRAIESQGRHPPWGIVLSSLNHDENEEPDP